MLLASERVGVTYGPAGVYATAFVSGLADVDAIALSLGALARDGTVAPEVASTGIVIAAVANTVVKAAIAWVFGTPRLGKIAAASLATVSAVGLTIAVAL